ncbi:MAG: VpsF family polysaccharide biosynthesis protein [Hyphomicrobiales bacterium]
MPAGAVGARAGETIGEARAPLLLSLLAVAAIAIAFAISPLMLLRLGVNYDETGGSLAAKIHPATYLLAATFLVRIFLEPRPARFLIAAAGRHGGAMAFLWAVVVLIAYAAVNLHLPLSPIVDTFLFPILALIVLDGVDEGNARLLARLVHAIYAANATLALFEMASGWRLTPLIAMGIDLLADRRSTALFGHPLGNAMLTGIYVIALAVGGGRDLPGWMRPMAILLQLTAMVSFGARLATVTTLGLIGLLTLRGIGRILAGRRFHIATAACFLGLLPLLVVALAGAYGAGFFDPLLERFFVSDNRSAEARIVMFELIPRFSAFQLLFGPDQDLLHSLMWTEGIEFGIESFWVSLLLTYGAVPSLLFLVGFGAFCIDLMRHSGKGAIWTMIFFLILVSGSLSLGGKTLALGILVIVDLILLRPPSGERSRTAWPCTDSSSPRLH